MPWTQDFINVGFKYTFCLYFVFFLHYLHVIPVFTSWNTKNLIFPFLSSSSRHLLKWYMTERINDNLYLCLRCVCIYISWSAIYSHAAKSPASFVDDSQHVRRGFNVLLWKCSVNLLFYSLKMYPFTFYIKFHCLYSYY